MLDILNAVFEVVGAIIVWKNFTRLRRDRRIEGVDWRVTAYYVSWGAFSLCYYAGVGHWLSFVGQLGILAANVAWVLLALRILFFPPSLSRSKSTH